MLPCKSKVAQLQQSHLFLYLFMPEFARRCSSGCWAGGSAQPAPLLAQRTEPNPKARQSCGLIRHSGAEPTDLHVQDRDGSRACCLIWVSLPCFCGGKWAIGFPKHQHGEHRSAGRCTFIQPFKGWKGIRAEEGCPGFSQESCSTRIESASPTLINGNGTPPIPQYFLHIC